MEARRWAVKREEQAVSVEEMEAKHATRHSTICDADGLRRSEMLEVSLVPWTVCLYG